MTRSVLHDAGQVAVMVTVGGLACIAATVYLAALATWDRLTNLTNQTRR